MKALTLATIITASLLSGCASVPSNTQQAQESIVVDMQGVASGAALDKYYDDLRECKEYSSRVDVGANTGNAAALGGLFGAVLGGMAGNRQTAGWVGLLTAAESAGKANAQSVEEVRTILRQCLRGRGYKVLN